MNIKLAFAVYKFPFCCFSHKDGLVTLEVSAFDGVLSVALRYDYDRRPLWLFSDICIGDSVEVILFAHRIELHVNGVLMDEEWPAGNLLFGMGDMFIPEKMIDVSEYFECNCDSPSVIASFENAEGWYPGNGVFVGDCMPYRRDNEYHVLYLKDRHHHSSKWGLGAHQWDHISTADFKTWNVHPMAVPITDASECSICTGSWIKHGDKEYLYYTVRMGRGLAAPVRRSISTDGYHFEKDTEFGFTISEQYHQTNVRDPKVIKGEDGLFHMFLTTVRIKDNKGCLVHYVSHDMEEWEDFGMPIYVSPDENEPECSDYFHYNGKYYLVFSILGKGHYMVSDEPFENFVMPSDPVIPCSGVPKGAEWQGKLVFTGFNRINGYAGSMTFLTATANEKGELVFE